MSSLMNYNGLDILTPDPTGDGGLAINNNFKKVSTKLDPGDPGPDNDETEGYGVGSRWINTTTNAEFVCTDATEDAAVWIGGWNVLASNTATSGTHIAMQIAPTYNQTSGTAANTDLLINRTESPVGSGNQYLIDAQVGGTSKFKVDHLGVLTCVALYVQGNFVMTGDFGGTFYTYGVVCNGSGSFGNTSYAQDAVKLTINGINSQTADLTQWNSGGSLKAIMTTRGQLVATSVSGTATSASSSVTPDADTYGIYNVATLTANATINAHSGTPVDGQTLLFRFVQDGTGGRTITWNSAFKFGTDFTNAMIPTAANAAFEVEARYDSTSSKWRIVSIVRGF